MFVKVSPKQKYPKSPKNKQTARQEGLSCQLFSQKKELFYRCCEKLNFFVTPG